MAAGDVPFRVDASRGFDILCAAAGSAVFTPVVLVAAGWIRWKDGQPALFTQERVGRDRKRFRIYKLRTLREGRPTPIGAWLRATGIDETLQFVNVLRGEMRIVGPRPLTELDVARLGLDDAAHDPRFSVPPGITGLAQLFAASAEESRRLDALYIDHRTLALDAAVIALSFAVNVAGKRRVRRVTRPLRRLFQPR